MATACELGQHRLSFDNQQTSFHIFVKSVSQCREELIPNEKSKQIRRVVNRCTARTMNENDEN